MPRDTSASTPDAPVIEYTPEEITNASMAEQWTEWAEKKGWNITPEKYTDALVEAGHTPADLPAPPAEAKKAKIMKTPQ